MLCTYTTISEYCSKGYFMHRIKKLCTTSSCVHRHTCMCRSYKTRHASTQNDQYQYTYMYTYLNSYIHACIHIHMHKKVIFIYT